MEEVIVELEEIKEKVNKSNKYLLYVELSDIKKLIKYIDYLEKQINLRIEEVHCLYKTISKRDNIINELYEERIPKDKIKEKMRGEINKSWKNTEQRKCQFYAYDILKELLGE